MPIAICLNCGEFKIGPWTRCQNCEFKPNDDESLTKHQLVSERRLELKALEAISARIKAGEAIEFDPITLQEAWVSKTQIDRDFNRGCMIVSGMVGVLFILAFAIAMALVLYL